MWQPQPGWYAVPGGTGPATVGVWRTVLGGRPVAIKRIGRPTADDPHEWRDPHHYAYWRREADVITTGLALVTPGLRGPVAATEEDSEGILLTSDWVEDAALNGLFVAHALGRFAEARLGERPWLATDVLRTRIARVERRGGWPTLARTTVADVADSLWRRREHFLTRYDALPHVAHHGDIAPVNTPGRAGDDVIAIDWSHLGTGPIGLDLGFHVLSAREEFEPLLDAYLLGLPAGVATGDEVAFGARVTAVYTALSRAEWALARVATGEGALAAKYRHPSVAPYLRSLQRQFPLIEALL